MEKEERRGQKEKTMNERSFKIVINISTLKVREELVQDQRTSK